MSESLKYVGRRFGAVGADEVGSPCAVASARVDAEEKAYVDGDPRKDLVALPSGGAFKHLNLLAEEAIVG